jgi:hypothetical protein
MNHQQISKIVKSLDDYFLVSSPNSSSTIKGKKSDWGNENSVFISRKLINGTLELEINGEDKDDNDMNINYYLEGSSNSYDKRVEIRGEFNLEAIQSGIRASVLYDANPPKEDDEE